jgi:DNA replication protein DnaC
MRLVRQVDTSTGDTCSTFEFMGRCKMTEVLSIVRGLKTAIPELASTTVHAARFSELLVYGTPGWGKSYMMAAAP